MKLSRKYGTVKKDQSKKPLKAIEEKQSQVENVLKSGDSQLIAKAIRNMLKKDEI